MTAVPAAGKRPVGDVIRRGFDNTVANWMVIVIRIGETFLFGMIAIASLIAIVVPMLVSAGVWGLDLKDAQNAIEAVTNLLTLHWIIIIWVLVVATVLLLVFALVHSFVVAGAARIFIDGDSTGRQGSRASFAAFTMERWLEGGRAGWLRVFWIYNLAYGAASLVILVPALALLVAIVVLHGSPAILIAGCLGLVMIVFVSVIAALVASIWCQKAIVVCLARSTGANDALRIAWHEARADPARHFAVALIMLVLGIGGVGVIGMLSLMITLPGATVPAAALIFMPMRLIISFVQSAFSSAVGNWTLASFAALDR